MNGSKYLFKSRRGTRDFAWAYIAVAVRLRLGPTNRSSGNSIAAGKENMGHIVNKMNLSASKPMLGLDLGFSRPIIILAKVICMGDVIVVPDCHTRHRGVLWSANQLINKLGVVSIGVTTFTLAYQLVHQKHTIVY